MIDTKGVVGLREERERLDAKKRKGQKLREKERSCCSQRFSCTQPFKGTQRKGIGARESLLSLLSNRKETEEEVMDRGTGVVPVAGGVKLRRMRTPL